MSVEFQDPELYVQLLQRSLEDLPNRPPRKRPSTEKGGGRGLAERMADALQCVMFAVEIGDFAEIRLRLAAAMEIVKEMPK